MYLLIISFFVFSILQVVDMACFDRGFYKRFYADNQTVEVIGISQNDLDKMTDTLIDYLLDKTDNMDVEIIDNGSVTQGFNQREKDHMVDVKNLYQAVLLIKNAALILLLASMCILYDHKSERFYQELFKAFIKVFTILFAIVLALGIFAVLDFDTFWTSFHHIFFRNDLWLLNPNTDRLILMVPGNFFFALVTKIVFYTIICWLLMFTYLFFKKTRSITND